MWFQGLLAAFFSQFRRSQKYPTTKSHRYSVTALGNDRYCRELFCATRSPSEYEPEGLKPWSPAPLPLHLCVYCQTYVVLITPKKLYGWWQYKIIHVFYWPISNIHLCRLGCVTQPSRSQNMRLIPANYRNAADHRHERNWECPILYEMAVQEDLIAEKRTRGREEI